MSDSIKGSTSGSVQSSDSSGVVTVNPTGRQTHGLSLDIQLIVEAVGTGSLTADYEVTSKDAKQELIETDIATAIKGDVLAFTDGPYAGREVRIIKVDNTTLYLGESLIELQATIPSGTAFEILRPRALRVTDLGGGGGSVPSIDQLISLTDGTTGTPIDLVLDGSPTDGELRTIVLNPDNLDGSLQGANSRDFYLQLASTILSSHNFNNIQTFNSTLNANGTFNSNGVHLVNGHRGGNISVAAGFGTTLSAGTTHVNIASGSGNIELMNQTGSSPNSSTGSRVTIHNGGTGTVTIVSGVATSGTSFGFEFPGGGNITLNTNESITVERNRLAGNTTWKLVAIGQIPSASGAATHYEVIQTWSGGTPGLLVNAGTGLTINWTTPSALTRELDLMLVPVGNLTGSFTGASYLQLSSTTLGAGVSGNPGFDIAINPNPVTGPPLAATQNRPTIVGGSTLYMSELLIGTIDPTRTNENVQVNFPGTAGLQMLAFNMQLIAVERK